MVKLQKHKAYVYKTEAGETIEHYKHLIVIPEKAVQDLGWRDGEEISWTITNNKLIFTSSDTGGSS